MTAYDTINQIDKETRKSLVLAGFLPMTTERNISIFERGIMIMSKRVNGEWRHGLLLANLKYQAKQLSLYVEK